MTDLRERLRSADPVREIRPLEEAEIVAMRRAIRSAAPAGGRPTLGFKLAAGLALAAAGLAVAVRLGPRKGAPAPVAPVAPIARVEAVPTPVPEPAPRRRFAPRPEPAEPPSSQLKEVRFVSANGTQILWTFRSPEEGA